MKKAASSRSIEMDIFSALVHGNKAKLKRPSLALLRYYGMQMKLGKFQAWPYCGAK